MKRRAGVCLAVAAVILACGAARGGVAKVEGGIEFTYHDPYAGSVHLAGQFNNWSMNTTPLTMDEDGTWRVVVSLAPGKYEYKFVVNGSEWVADPDNPRIVGAYGNSEVVIDEDGEPVIPGGVAAISNTPVNSRVMINGWYRATYETRSDVPSDPRWRLSRPSHEFYISVSPTIGEAVSGSATLRATSGAGDIKEIHVDVYSGHVSLEGGPFSVTGWYNEEAVQFDDPLELVGHMDLPGTLVEEHIAFGRGAQGVTAKTSFLGIDATAVYANQYDFDYRNDPSVYDNTDTDFVGGRLKRPVGPLTVGVTYASWRDGWWIDWTGTNECPSLDEYIAESGTTSDWFELSNTEQWIGADVAWPGAVGGLDLRAEYASFGYKGLWDMGNREKVEGEDYSNGAIDVPFGDAKGWALTGEVAGSPIQSVDVGLKVTKASFDGMDGDEEYVAFVAPGWWEWMACGHGVEPGWWEWMACGHGVAHLLREYTEVRYDGSPLTVDVFGALPEFEAWAYELDAGLSFGIFDLGLEYDRTTSEGAFPEDADWVDGPAGYDASSARFAGRFRADILKDRLWLELEGGSLTYELDADEGLGDLAESAELFDTLELIARGRVSFSDCWGLLMDVRRITYKDVSGGGARGTGDESFLAPYFGISYSPRENVEVRLGYGVDPMNYMDTPVEGRSDGRERWRAQYLWDHSDYGVLEAEKALEDARTVGLMAVIVF